MLVKFGFSRFTEDSRGHTIAHSECTYLSRCIQDIKPRLPSVHVVDASLRSEVQLLWDRVGTETNFMLMGRSIRKLIFPQVFELLQIIFFILSPFFINGINSSMNKHFSE